MKDTEEPLFATSTLGHGIKVSADRIDFKSGAGKQSVPIGQIASVNTAMMGMNQITIETAGGKKYKIPCNKKAETKKAIYAAQSIIGKTDAAPESVADEIIKLDKLRKAGAITEEEFNNLKAKLL